MKTYLIFSLVIFLVMIMVSSLIFTNVHALQIVLHKSNNQADLPWERQYIQRELDPIRDVGRYISMALRPFDNYPVISYYDFTNADLMLAIPVPNHLGNCGTENNWLCDSLDGDTDAVGMFSSIDVWGSSVADWRLGIAYYDITNQSLKAAIWYCSSGVCIKNYVTVDEPSGLYDIVGLYPSLKFDSTGMAAISYFKLYSQANDSNLMYVIQVPGGGNCGKASAAGLWECTLISMLSGEGRYSSLDLGYDNVPYISYYDASSEQLRLAYNSGSGWNCDEFGWSCIPLDGGVGGVGMYPSIQAPNYPGDVYRVAYHDKPNGQLKYFTEDWGPVVVDGMGASTDPMGISMVIDNDGYPVIAYQRIESDFSPPQLWIARPYLAYDDGAYGNCGTLPPGMDEQYWRCAPLDLGSSYTEEADYVSAIVNSNGHVAIAYAEYDSSDYYYSAKFIYQANPTYYTFVPIIARH